MGTYTYVTKKKCPVCKEETQVVKMRSRLLVEKTDEDFCVHYKDANPYLYKIWICEHCGFAGDENTFTKGLPTRHREMIEEHLKAHPVKVPFKEERELKDAVLSYKLGLFFEEMRKTPPSARAGLFLRLGWVYRIAGDSENEKQQLENAIELYDESLATERYPIGNMTDTMAMYLIGAMSYRIGNLEKATQYISRIMSDQKVRDTEQKLFERTRDLWQTIREKKEG